MSNILKGLMQEASELSIEDLLELAEFCNDLAQSLEDEEERR